MKHLPKNTSISSFSLLPWYKSLGAITHSSSFVFRSSSCDSVVEEEHLWLGTTFFRICLACYASSCRGWSPQTATLFWKRWKEDQENTNKNPEAEKIQKNPLDEWNFWLNVSDLCSGFTKFESPTIKTKTTDLRLIFGFILKYVIFSIPQRVQIFYSALKNKSQHGEGTLFLILLKAQAL